jgi:MoxR-like ATPase
MAMAARARGFMEGRNTVGFEDVRAVALPVLRHRVILDYSARLEGMTSDSVVGEIVESVPEMERAAPASVAERLA